MSVLGFARSTNVRQRVSALAALSIATAALCVAVAFLPPVLDALTNRGGNLRRLRAFFIGNSSGEGVAGLFKAQAFLGSFISTPLGLPDWFGALTLLALVVTATWQHILHASPYRVEATVGLTALLGALIGAAGIRGPQFQYLMLPVTAIVPLLAVLCVRDCGSAPSKRRMPPLFSSAVIVTLCLTFSVWLSSRWKTPETNECADSLEPFIAHFTVSKTELLELRPVGAESWQALASSVYRLYRDGYSVCVPARWGFMVGAEFSCIAESNGATPRRRFHVNSAGVIIEKNHSLQ